MTSWLTLGSRSMMFLTINSKSESQRKDDHGSLALVIRIVLIAIMIVYNSVEVFTVLIPYQGIDFNSNV